MSDQMELFAVPPSKTCDVCTHYSALKNPRVRSDNATIYGYCFKAGDKDYSTGMGKGFPVFIDGGHCDKYAKKEKEATHE